MVQQPEAFIIHDGTTIHECNEAFCELFRCPCDSLVGRRVEEIIHDPDLRQLARWRGRRIMSIKEDREFVQSYDFTRCDGTRFWGTAHSRRIAPDRYQTKIIWEYDD